MRRLVVVLIVALVIAGAWFVWGGGPAEGGAPGVEVGARATVAASASGREARGATEDEARAEKRRADRRARDALRGKIVEALARGEAEPARVRDEGGDGEAGAAARKGRVGAGEEAPPTPGSLVDRSGNRGYLMKTMNEELMPLVDECFALARATNPALKGELRLNVELLGDAELGGVVDSVEPDANNELGDPGLVECARESILATTLPPPPQGGRDAFMLSLKLGAEDDAAAGE